MPINYPETFFFAVVTTAAFAVLFQAPKSTLLQSGLIGGVGWGAFCLMRHSLEVDSFYANLVATIVLAILGELAARVFMHPATVFVIPGIFPIVPGLGMYRGMAKLIENHYDEGMAILLAAAKDAAAIAIGIMFVASFFRVIKISREQQHLLQLLRIEKKKQSEN